MMRKRAVPLLLGLLAVLGGCATFPDDPYYESGPYYGGYGQGVPMPPPPSPYEYYGAPPVVGYVWIGGYWQWGGANYVWIPGRWEPPRPGHHWVPHGWDKDGDRWRPHGGHWAPDGYRPTRPLPPVERPDDRRPSVIPAPVLRPPPGREPAQVHPPAAPPVNNFDKQPPASYAKPRPDQGVEARPAPVPRPRPEKMPAYGSDRGGKSRQGDDDGPRVKRRGQDDDR